MESTLAVALCSAYVIKAKKVTRKEYSFNPKFKWPIIIILLFFFKLEFPLRPNPETALTINAHYIGYNIKALVPTCSVENYLRSNLW